MTEPTTIETALDCFLAGRLRDAVLAATDLVRANPADIRLRSALAEYLCLTGELKRAERQFDIVATQAPATAPRVTELRQFVRAGLARREVWRDGRMPDLIAPAPVHLRLRLEALLALREGRPEEAAERISAAETERPLVTGYRDRQPFDDLRDLDDLTGGILEVMSSTGQYFWVPLEQVSEIIVERPGRPIDAGWTSVELTVRDGPVGRVVVPSLYPEPAQTTMRDSLRLGRETDWTEEPGGWVRGAGLRCFLIGSDSISLREIGTLSFGTPR